MPELNAAQQLAAFTSVVWTPDDLIEVRCLPTARDGGPQPVSLWIPARCVSEIAPKLAGMNDCGLNVYAGILPRTRDNGRSDADAADGLCAWADFDRISPRDAWEYAVAQGIPKASMVVNSGHGTHLYWALTEKRAPADLSALVGDIAALCGSDRTVRNPSRILRLPGFTNHKPPVAACTLLRYDAARRYSFDELRKAVPVPKPLPVTPPSTSRQHGTHAQLVDRASKYVAEIPGAGEGRRNAEAFRVAAVLRNDFELLEQDAWGVLCEWNSRNSPPLDERELRSVFDSGKRYAKAARGRLASAPLRVDESPRTDRRQPVEEESVTTTAAIAVAVESDENADMRNELSAQAAGTRVTLPMPWTRLGSLSNALRPGTVCVIAGPAKTGKSFIATRLAMHLYGLGVDWRYLPLEDRRTDFKFRLLACLADDYSMIDVDEEGAQKRADAMLRYEQDVLRLSRGVTENPRVGHKGPDGKTVVPPLPYEAILQWVDGVLTTGARVVFIDPISQIEFPTRDSYAHESAFLRQLLAYASDSGATVVLLAHTIKRPGKSASLPLTLEDVQGAAAFGRLAQTVLLFDAHEVKQSPVFRAGGYSEPVQHNRTFIIAAARNGSGTRSHIAFSQSPTAPRFEEHGVIDLSSR